MQQRGATTETIETSWRAARVSEAVETRLNRLSRTDDCLCGIVSRGRETSTSSGVVVRSDQGNEMHRRDASTEEHGYCQPFVPRMLQLWAKDDEEREKSRRDSDHGDENRGEDRVPVIRDARDRTDRHLSDIVCKAASKVSNHEPSPNKNSED